jgi:hypothetical protein
MFETTLKHRDTLLIMNNFIANALRIVKFSSTYVIISNFIVECDQYFKWTVLLIK